MNKHQGFLVNNNQVKNNQIKHKNNNAAKYFTLASMSALLAACGSEATTGNDTITLGSDGKPGFIDALAGDDKITGGDFADFIRGGAGADIINGGAGVDNIVVVGTTSNAGYTLSDITNPNGSGINLSIVLKLNALNNNAVSDISDGEVIDGGVDGARLFVYGEVDFTNATLKNITRIDVQSKVTFSATQLKELIDSGQFKALIGDGTTQIIIEDSGVAVELDFSGVDMQNVKEITVGENATLLLDQDDLQGVEEIKGDGSIKAVSGTLNVSGITVASAVTVVASTVTPAVSANSSITKTAASMANASIDGLDGTDTLTITGSLGVAAFSFTTPGANGANVVNYEKIIFGNGGNVITGFDSAVKDITGGTGIDNITITGMATGGTIELGNGNDILTALTKTFVEATGASLKGETGTADSLVFSALGASEGVSLSNVTGFEVLTFVDSDDTTHAITLADDITSITVDTDNATEVFNITVTAAQSAALTSLVDTTGTGSLNIVLSAAGTANISALATSTNVNVQLANGTNTFVASGEADTIIGGTGADNITGGEGIDTVTGGAGADTFNYADTVLVANAMNVVEFVTADDVFNFTAANYAAAAGGVTIADAFTIGALGAGAGVQYVLVDTLANIQGADLSGQYAGGALAYDTTNDRLLFDADGNFSDGSELIIGTMTTLTGALSDADFVFV